MEKAIRDAYNDQILDEVLGRYGVARDGVRMLDGFENFIYAYEKGGADYVLRVSHSLHRTADQTQGEIEWLNYLADNGVPVARAVPSARGNLVEPIAVDAASHFTAVSFAWALGEHPTKEDWEGGLPVQLGQIVGRMHALTKDFVPGQPRFRRPDWYEDAEGFAEKYLPPTEGTVIDRYNRLVARLRALPAGRDAYGLIHVDVHGGNFFVHEGQVTLFDFDDCVYAWFAYDIAMALFYAISHDCVREEDVGWADRFFGEFMAGYRQENAIAPEWVARVPLFLKLREVDLYVAIHRSLDLDDLDPWCASFMKDRKRKIEHNVPYVKLDWSKYVEEM